MIVQEDFEKVFVRVDLLLNVHEFFFTDLIVQEDGVVFREESGGNNERIGQYRFLIIDYKPLSLIIFFAYFCYL